MRIGPVYDPFFVPAQLVGEPFNVPLHEFAELTDRQIKDVYFRERDEHGKVAPPPVEVVQEDEKKPPTKEDERLLLFGMGRSLGVPEQLLQAAWLQKYPEDTADGSHSHNS